MLRIFKYWGNQQRWDKYERRTPFWATSKKKKSRWRKTKVNTGVKNKHHRLSLVFFNTPFVILEFLLHMLYIHRTYDHTDIKSVGSNTPGNWLLLHKTLAAIYICIHWLLGIHTCRQGTQTRSKQKAKLESQVPSCFLRLKRQGQQEKEM